MKHYYISSHTYYPDGKHDTYGPPHTLYDFLRHKSQDVYFIKHDIGGEVSTKILNQKEEIIFSGTSVKNQFIRYCKEIYITVSFIASNCVPKNKKKRIYIGIDPINGVAGALLKLIGKIDKNIYFSVDYTNKRFLNRALNTCYFILDRVSVFFADEVWSVSRRIQQVRFLQGVLESRNKLVPNSIEIDAGMRTTYDGNRNLIIVSNLEDTLYIEPVLTVLKQLIKIYPDLVLYVIGMGSKQASLVHVVALMKLEKHVQFLGSMTHEQVIKKIRDSFLGFAFYVHNGGNMYGDSMKVREYIACGIPVIMNDVSSTADDVRTFKAGLVVSNITNEEIERFIRTCLTQPTYYKHLRENAIKMGDTFDKKKILTDLLLQ